MRATAWSGRREDVQYRPAMARLRTLTRVAANSKRHPTEVDAEWTLVRDSGGPYFQLSTFGSDDRKLERKMSQTVQLDRQMATDLVSAIREAFPEI